jgi:hypothetical protein
MDTPLSELYGVGPVAKRVFDRAGLTKCGHVYSAGGQEEAVRTAARELAEIDGTAEAGHWRALATYCVTVIRRVRSLVYTLEGSSNESCARVALIHLSQSVLDS